jgi:hypothetical protein
MFGSRSKSAFRSESSQVGGEAKGVLESVAGSKPFRNESGKSRDTQEESESPSIAERHPNEHKESAEQKRP